MIDYLKVANTRNITRESVKLIPCTESSPELDISSENVKQFMLTQNLFCLEEPDWIELHGVFSLPARKFINVIIHKCD